MSEPVIKARLWCSQCGLVGRSHTTGRTQAFRVRHVVREGYTRDDIVRAVVEAQDCVWVKNSYDEGSTAVFDESPEQIVDRLTKGDV